MHLLGFKAEHGVLKLDTQAKFSPTDFTILGQFVADALQQLG
jgi:hypothetical protein